MAAEDQAASREQRRQLLKAMAERGTAGKEQFEAEAAHAAQMRKDALSAAATAGTQINAPGTLQAELAGQRDAQLGGIDRANAVAKASNAAGIKAIGDASAHYIGQVNDAAEGERSAALQAARTRASSGGGGRGRSSGGSAPDSELADYLSSQAAGVRPIEEAAAQAGATDPIINTPFAQSITTRLRLQLQRDPTNREAAGDLLVDLVDAQPGLSDQQRAQLKALFDNMYGLTDYGQAGQSIGDDFFIETVKTPGQGSGRRFADDGRSSWKGGKRQSRVSGSKPTTRKSPKGVR